MVNVSETCGCGASFTAEGDGVVRLLREWRNNHTCTDRATQDSDVLHVSSNAQVEQVIGFQMSGLTVPGRVDHALDDGDE